MTSVIKKYIKCFGNCSKKNLDGDFTSYPKVNLNEISITTNLEKEYKRLPKKYTINLYYQGERMKQERKLQEGGYGAVYLYRKGDKQVVVKKAFRNHLEEPEKLTGLLKKAEECKQDYIVPIKIIYDQARNPFIVMQRANGDLLDIIDETNNQFRYRLAAHLIKTIMCFDKEDICYSDLKLENILYLVQDKEIEIYLADVGSFCNYGDEDFTATFVPPEYFLQNSRKWKATKALTYYVLGITIGQMYGFELPDSKRNDNTYPYDEYKTVINPDLEARIEESKINKKIKYVILNLINIKENERISKNLKHYYNVLKG